MLYIPIMRKHLERGAIAITGLLLVASLVSLGGKIVARRAVAAEPYPDLYSSANFEYMPVTEKTVYLTFDDGPSANTEEILEVLREEDVKATFFVCAQQDTERDVPAILQKIVEEGHQLGLHTYTHDYSIYRSMDAYLEDLNKINSYIEEHTGQRPQILRFPGGSCTGNCPVDVMQNIVDEVTRRGYVYYDWNVVSGDDSTYVQDADFLAECVMRQIQDLDCPIILFHDGPTPTTTAQAVRQLIPQLRERGYTFDKLTPQVRPVQLRKPTSMEVAGEMPVD